MMGSAVTSIVVWDVTPRTLGEI